MLKSIEKYLKYYHCSASLHFHLDLKLGESIESIIADGDLMMETIESIGDETRLSI